MKSTDWAGIQVSSKRCKAEILSHGCSWDEFLEEYGVRDSYDGLEVLQWLGY